MNLEEHGFGASDAETAEQVIREVFRREGYEITPQMVDALLQASAALARVYGSSDLTGQAVLLARALADRRHEERVLRGDPSKEPPRGFLTNGRDGDVFEPGALLVSGADFGEMRGGAAVCVQHGDGRLELIGWTEGPVSMEPVRVDGEVRGISIGYTVRGRLSLDLAAEMQRHMRKERRSASGRPWPFCMEDARGGRGEPPRQLPADARARIARFRPSRRR